MREYGLILLPARWSIFGLFDAGGMNMRGSTFALMITCAALMIGSALAQGTYVPGDNNGDKIVSAEELAAAEKLEQERKLSADEMEEIKHIYEKYPINITDSANRTVTIYKPVKTIIPMSASNYEPIILLAATDKIAGVREDLQKNYAWIPGMIDKPVIGASNEIDYEKVIELRPDIVITAASDVSVLENRMRLAEIPYLILFRTLDQDAFDKDLKTLSNVLEKEKRADEFLSWKHDLLNQLKTNEIMSANKAKVYCETPHHDFYTTTKKSGAHDIINMAGGDNIASDLTGQPYCADVEPEWVMNKNPDVIILMTGMANYTTEDSDMDNLDRFLKLAYNRTGLKETNAAVKGHIFLINPAYTDWGRGFIGASYMAKWFYPDIFKDLDPEAINKKYFEKWLGVPYKGIWVYPIAS